MTVHAEGDELPFADRRTTGRQTDITNLMVTFRKSVGIFRKYHSPIKET